MSLAATVALTAFLSGVTADTPPSAETEIDALQRELIPALKSGDRPALERFIADGFTFVHATGGLDTQPVMALTPERRSYASLIAI